jgi:hypothetical protein
MSELIFLTAAAILSQHLYSVLKAPGSEHLWILNNNKIFGSFQSRQLNVEMQLKIDANRFISDSCLVTICGHFCVLFDAV